MIFSLDVRRARKGDCLLLHFGSKTEPGLVVIDGGPKSVYKPHLRPRLVEIGKKRKLAEGDPLVIDAMMVSHVDDDHIQGILDLTREMREAQAAHQPQLVQVLSFWHNSFDAIVQDGLDTVTKTVRGHLPTSALAGGDLPDDKVDGVEALSDESREVVEGGLKVLASIEQGFRLREDTKTLGYPLNPDFGGKLVMAAKDGTPKPVGGNLRFTVVGPMRPELDALRKKHNDWVEQMQKQGKLPEAALAAYVDKSVPNLSSIVVLAEAGDKKILLTGDARGDKVIEGLQLVKKLGPGAKSTIKVDVLKVPHHGSSNNLDNDFFERIIADHYVFSGDGEHGNPEREALEMLFRARGKDAFTIHLTYPVAEIDVARKEEWDKQRAAEQKRKAKTVRPPWSPETHSLGAFIAATSGASKKIVIVDAKKPHVIDLLDPLGF